MPSLSKFCSRLSQAGAWRIFLGLWLALGVSACGGTSSSPPLATLPAPSTGRIEGVHFDDLNDNDRRDPGEPGLPGITTFLDLNGNDRLDAGEPNTVSDANGNFRFSDLSAGTYRVAAILPPGRVFTTPRAGSGLERIVGGSLTPQNLFPWMVALLQAGVSNTSDPFDLHFCGGSLIHPRWVLTAAHCLFDPNNNQLQANQVQVLVGTTRLLPGTGQLVGVSQIVFPNQTSDGFVYDRNAIQAGRDIALLELATPVSLPTVPLLRPSQAQFASPGTLALAVGWGITVARDPNEPPNPAFRSRFLRHVQLPIYSDAACQGAYQNTPLDPIAAQILVCAGFPQGGRSGCQGDSGGPLLVRINGGFALAGITSFGLGCAQPGYPTVFTRVYDQGNFGFVTRNVPGLNLFVDEDEEPEVGSPLETAASLTVTLREGEVVSGVNFGSRAL